MKSPGNPTEADFEEAIARVLRIAFAGMSQGELRHQTSFRIRLGHKHREVRSGFKNWLAGRSDILITRNGTPLALLELKRPGIEISEEDRLQGLSYARLMEPWPPLVVVTNGTKTKIFETYRGGEWDPTSRDETAVSSLFEQSARLAQNDLSLAVETLLGTEPQCWMELVRDFTDEQIAALTGRWSDLLAPFADDLLFPRKATGSLGHCLETTTDCIPLIVGPPLCGKSNVLREFANAKRHSEDCAVLYLDAESLGQGIFRCLANLMSQSLGWQFDTNQLRVWLRRLSHSQHAPSLIILVDGGDPGFLKAELDELASTTYGRRLRIVVAVDESLAEQLTRGSKGRQLTKFGRRCAVIAVTTLDDEEFKAAQHLLFERRVGFFPGSDRTAEFRVPWLLRSIVSLIAAGDGYKDERLMCVLPSIPGFRPLWLVEKQFAGNGRLQGCFLRIAEALVAEAEDSDRSAELHILSLTVFACREEVLRKHLSDAELSELISLGYLKRRLLRRERLLIAQVPMLAAAHLARYLMELLIERLQESTHDAASWLVAICTRLPFGEVLGAKAVLDAASHLEGVPYELVSELLNMQPQTSVIPPGSKMLAEVGGKFITLELDSERRLFMTRESGKRVVVGEEVDDSMLKTHSGVMAWLILSHAAAVPLIAHTPGHPTTLGRLEHGILLEVGKCKFVLRRPEGNEPDRIRVHEIDDDTAIACHDEGIVEPITCAIMNALAHADDAAFSFVCDAKQSGSLPLLSRMNTSLMYLEDMADARVATWAATVRSQDILPAFKGTLIDH